MPDACRHRCRYTFVNSHTKRCVRCGDKKKIIDDLGPQPDTEGDK